MPFSNENRDALTGLANWKYVQSVLPRILGHNGQVGLILADVDHLKTYMDHFGLLEGDNRLREIAREIEGLSGKNALIFRYGGGEFGVILYESSLEQARQIAEKIRVGRVPVVMQTKPIPTVALTLSLGVAHFPTDAEDEKTLFWGVELALLKAKRIGESPFGRTCIGRNRVMAVSDFLNSE